MKTINRNLKRLALSLSASLLLGGLLPARAQFASPVGDSPWDCVISGREQGVAYITFNEDGTLTGYEVLSPTSVSSSSTADPRGLTHIGRTVETNSNGTVTTYVRGFTDFTGYWTHDYTGKKILGFFSEVTIKREPCTTTEVTESRQESYTYTENGTNFTATRTVFDTRIETNCPPDIITTNSLSFSAIVKPGARLSVKAYTPNGNRTLKGVPATEITDSFGSYYAEGKKNGLVFYNTFTAAASGDFNAFDIAGDGGGYSFAGIALASKQKKLGLVSPNLVGNSSLVTLFGSVNYGKGSASLKGTDGASQVTYKIKPQP